MKKDLIGALLLTSVPVWAVLPHGATPAEVAMCEARGMPGGQGRYQGHYCDGLRFTDRAYSAMGNKQDMKYYLEVAIDNFNYVLGHTKEDDAMRGEVHVGKARALKLMGRNAEAAVEFIKALRYKPDSPDAYQALADHYREAGNKQQALEMATEGLKRNPNSKGLKRRYTELGGKLPYPAAADIKAAPDSSTPSAKTESATISPPAAMSTAVDAPSAVAPNEPAKQDDPKIGAPGNPFCRFCPN